MITWFREEGIDGQRGKDFEINDKTRMSLSPDPDDDDDLGKQQSSYKAKYPNYKF